MSVRTLTDSYLLEEPSFEDDFSIDLIDSTYLARSDYESVFDVARKVAVIAGAGSNTSREPIRQLLESGWKVIGLTGNERMKELENEDVKFVIIDRTRLKDQDYVREKIEQGLTAIKVHGCSQLLGINLIGSSVAPKGGTLRDVNVEIPSTFFHTIEELGKEKAEITSVAHISSIAARINGEDCEYSNLKRLIDDEILHLDVNGNIIILRPGIILPNPTEDGRVNMGHDYSPDQFWNGSKFIFCMGSGEQLQQPIAEEDLYRAMINGIEHDRKPIRQVFDAVSEEVLTQKELFVMHNQREKVYVFHMPYGFAKYIAKHYPMGRIAPYSVQLFEELEGQTEPIDHAPFEELHGRRSTSVTDLYDLEKQHTGRKLPVGKHTKAIAKKCFTTRKAYLGFPLIWKAITELPKIKFTTHRK